MSTEENLAGDGPQDVPEVAAEDPREAWLEFALADRDGGAAVLATAARHGRPLPPLTEG